MLEASRELSLEEIIDRFQTDIGQLNADDTQPLPDLSSEINHNAKFVKVGAGMLPGIYLDPGDEVSEGLYAPDLSYAFQNQPGNRLTREDSHNKVFFGRFWMVPEGDQQELHTQVAVKSREMKHKSLLIGETALFQHIGSIGLKTFRPAGLVVGAEAVHLMTYFDGSVATMDTVEWSEATPDEAWAELGKAVETLYKLHTNLLFHGDLEFRNIAFDHTGDTVIIDPELMISVRENVEPLIEAGIVLDEEQTSALGLLAQKMSHELTQICTSIDEEILPLLPKDERPRTNAAKLKLHRKYLFEPYRNMIREADEPVRSVLLRGYDEMMRRKKALAKQ